MCMYNLWLNTTELPHWAILSHELIMAVLVYAYVYTYIYMYVCSCTYMILKIRVSNRFGILVMLPRYHGQINVFLFRWESGELAWMGFPHDVPIFLLETINGELDRSSYSCNAFRAPLVYSHPENDMTGASRSNRRFADAHIRREVTNGSISWSIMWSIKFQQLMKIARVGDL